LILALVLGGFAVTTRAQENAADEMVLKRVQNMRNQNDATERAMRQGDGSSSGSATSTAAAPPPQRANSREQAIAKLKADIIAVRSKGEATPEMKTQFARDLLSASMGDNQASLATLTKFSNSLLPIVATKGVTDAGDARMMQDLMVALNSHGLSTDRIGELGDEVKGALDKAGADSTATVAVAENLKSIGADVQAGTK
jgi:hypothetical protein